MAFDKKKVLDTVTSFDIQKLLQLSNDPQYKDKALQDVGLTFLHITCTIQPSRLADRSNLSLTEAEEKITQIIDTLILKGHNTDNGRTPLHYAAASGNSRAIRTLIRNSSIGVNPLTMGNETPLMFAVRFQNHKSVETLLSFGVDFMTKNNIGQTAYSLATISKHPTIEPLMREMYQRYRRRIQALFVFDAKFCKKETSYNILGIKERFDIISYL